MSVAGALVALMLSLLGAPSSAPPRQGALACSPRIQRLPCRHGMQLHVGYRLDLGTHCGIVAAWFDGRLWIAKPRLSDGSDNPPSGWGNPWQRGWIRLLTRSRADFRAGAALIAHFAPAPPTFRVGRCE